MKVLLFRFITILLLFFSFSFAQSIDFNKKISQITVLTKAHLYNYDIAALKDVVNQSIQTNDDIVSIVILDNSSDTVLYQAYQEDGKIFAYKSLTNIDKDLIIIKQNIVHNSNIIGQITAYCTKSEKVSFNFEEKRWLKDNPNISIAIMNYWAEDNEGDVLETALFKLLNKYAKINIVPKRYSSWKDGFEEAIIGDDIYGISRLSWSKEREKNYFRYSQSYHFTPLVLITKNNNTTIKSMKDIKDETVYILDKTVVSTILKDISPTTKIIPLNTKDELYKQLSQTSSADAILTYSIDRQKIKKYDLKIVEEISNRYGEVAIGVHHKYPILSSILNKAYKMIPTYELLNLAKKNFNSNKIKLTIAEKAYIKKHTVIKIGDGSSWAPIGFVDKNNKYVGLSKDYLDIISKNTGLNFQMVIGNWSEYFKSMKDENSTTVDMLNTVSYQEERMKLLSYTDPYITMVKYFYIRKDIKANKISDLDGKIVAIPKGYSDIKIIKKNFPKIKILEVSSFSKAIDAVVTKKADILFDNNTILAYTLKKEGINSIIPFMAYRKDGVDEVRMASRKNNPLLASIVNKGLNSITQVQKQQIYEKWIGKQVLKVEKNSKKIELSIKEENWINKHPIINFVADPEYQPFEFMDKDGNYSGIASSYLEIVSQKTGLNFKPTKIKNWLDGVQKIENRQSDMFSCAKKTSSREKILNFSIPYIEYSMVMVTKKDKSFLDNIKALYNKTVVAIKGFATIELILKQHPKIKVIYVNNTTEALQLVSDNKAYSFISALPAASYYINKKGFFDLKIAGKLDGTSKLRISIRNDWDATGINIINKALKSISDKEKDDIYNKWVSVTYHQQVDYTIVWQLLFIFIFILLGTLFWMRKLKNEISHRKKIEENLLHSQGLLELETQKAVLASQSKSEFLANMSHEIRTPMNSVIGFADLLSNLIKDPVQKDYLHSIKTGGKALLTIINDILDLSKIEAGKFEIEKEAINPRALFEEMNVIFSAKINQKNLIFVVDIDEKLPHSIIIDSVRIRQILINLIGNAIKFTNKGTITLKIENIFKDNIKSRIDLKISIIDTGRGIPKEFLETIFGAFEQTTAADSRSFAGTGLGLAISSKLTTLMNGTIKVTSEIQKGSTFEVLLKDIDVSSLEIIPETDDILDERVIFDKAKLLIVDDVAANRKLVFATLHDSNLDIIEAVNGEEAVDVVLNTPDIDLILMDLRMPVMDGYQATAKIREDNRKRDIPIIAFTASVMGKDLEKIQEYGFDGYLRKPIDYDTLVKELKRYLSYKTQQSDEHIDENEVLSKEIIENIPKVLELLTATFKQQLDEIKDKGNFNLIEALMLEIQELGKNNSLKIVERYTTSLLSAIESFDIDKVDAIVNNYDIMCDKLKKILEVNN